MSKRKIIISVLILVVAAAAVYSYKEFTRTNKDLRYVKPQVTIEADSLIREFTVNDSVADHKYRNKIIAVHGMVKGIDSADGQYTIAMGDTNILSSLRFSMDTSSAIKAAAVQRGMSITVKGAITGFKKDETGLLGDDIEFNRCVIQQE